MWRMVKKLVWVCVAVTAALFLIYARFGGAIWFTLAVASATGTYHIVMRRWVGNFWNAVLHNHADYRRRWFRVSQREARLYQKLRVRRWKNKMPTNDPESFSPKTHSWDEVAQTMCQSELVHETSVVLSFLPLLAVPWIGGFFAFLSTSVLVAAVDTLFVMMQRYNRGRIVRLLDRQQDRR